MAPPNSDHYKLYFDDFIKSNVTVTAGRNSSDVVVNTFFSDIGNFYHESLNMPYTSIFGFLTVIVFFVLLIRLFFWFPMRKIIYRILEEHKIIRSESNHGRKSIIEDRFVESLEDYYLKEKIRIMRRMKQVVPISQKFLKSYNEMLDLYVNEYKKRKHGRRYKRYIKGVPFYDLEFLDEFRKDFGSEYTPRLIHISSTQEGNDQEMSQN